MCIDKIKKEVRRIKSKGKAARYPKELISEILQKHRQGIGIEDLARKIGVSQQTIRFWLERSKSQDAVPVRRSPSNIISKNRELRLYFPDGRWVEGLSLEDIQRLQIQDVVSKKGA